MAYWSKNLVVLISVNGLRLFNSMRNAMLPVVQFYIQTVFAQTERTVYFIISEYHNVLQTTSIPFRNINWFHIFFNNFLHNLVFIIC